MSKTENKKAYVFFNCDAAKSANSMNPGYNRIAYSSVRSGRRALWDKVKKELTEKRIQIKDDQKSSVRKAILFDDPVDANQYLTYGYIAPLDFVG